MDIEYTIIFINCRTKVIKESFFALGSITFLNFGEKWKYMKARKASNSAGYKVQKMFTIQKGEKCEISRPFLILYMG